MGFFNVGEHRRRRNSINQYCVNISTLFQCVFYVVRFRIYIIVVPEMYRRQIQLWLYLCDILCIREPMRGGKLKKNKYSKKYTRC